MYFSGILCEKPTQNSESLWFDIVSPFDNDTPKWNTVKPVAFSFM